MQVKDIMSYNVVTVPSSTSIAEAKRIMAAHRIKRLPVVDKGKLKGIVTSRSIEQASPSKASSLSIWELTYLLDRITVKEVMTKNVVTVPPDMDAEEVVALAQKNRIGSVVVMENDAIVGIVTSDDFFESIINPLLGINIPGTRIEVTGGLIKGKGLEQMENLVATIHKHGHKITTIHIESPQEEINKVVCFHLQDSDKIEELVDDFKSQGFTVRVRNR